VERVAAYALMQVNARCVVFWKAYSSVFPSDQRSESKAIKLIYSQPLWSFRFCYCGLGRGILHLGCMRRRAMSDGTFHLRKQVFLADVMDNVQSTKGCDRGILDWIDFHDFEDEGGP
jgi:hypothetical protein